MNSISVKIRSHAPEQLDGKEIQHQLSKEGALVGVAYGLMRARRISDDEMVVEVTYTDKTGALTKKGILKQYHIDNLHDMGGYYQIRLG